MSGGTFSFAAPGDAIASAAAVVSTVCAVYVAFRDGQWKKNGIAKRLERRIEEAQDAADRWHETERAMKLIAEVDRQGAEILKHGAAMQHVATKEDMAHLEGAIKQAAKSARDAAAGVDRIEDILMKKALNA